MMSSQSFQSLLQSIKTAAPADESERQQLYNAARNLMFESESEMEMINRIVYCTQCLYMHQIGVELGLFDKIAANKQPTSIEALASSTGADKTLLSRILRYLASEFSIEQVDATHYQATHITRALTNKGYQGGILHSAKCGALATVATPAFLEKTNYRNPADSANCPFQSAMKTDLPAWQWSLTRPDLTNWFMQFMQASSRPDETWSTVVDVPALCAGSIPDTPVFVDVGGSIGHQSVGFRTTFPSIPGRVILQDLAGPIEHALPCEGVEAQVVDFWAPQQVKDARIYYLRQILHDFPDEKCIELLRITQAAMGRESVIAIDEMVLPDVGAHWRAATMDINMLSTLASTERTETEWRALLARAGLVVKEIGRYVADTASSVIIAVPEGRD